MTVPSIVPELDIFFQKGRGPSDSYVEELTDHLMKHPPTGVPMNVSREDLAKFVARKLGDTGQQKKVETSEKPIARDRCPDCNAKFAEGEIRSDGYVICKTCRKRFKPSG